MNMISQYFEIFLISILFLYHIHMLSKHSLKLNISYEHFWMCFILWILSLMIINFCLIYIFQNRHISYSSSLMHTLIFSKEIVASSNTSEYILLFLLYIHQFLLHLSQLYWILASMCFGIAMNSLLLDETSHPSGELIKTRPEVNNSN